MRSLSLNLARGLLCGAAPSLGSIISSLWRSIPLVFSFDFRTDDPSDGGWLIGFNAAGTNVINVDDSSEVELRQFSGSRALCTVFQTSAGPSVQCADLVHGQRDFTAMAHILGRINSDFSATIRIKYNDGQQPDTVTIKTSAPTGAIQSPLGSTLWFGNINQSYGPHFFDNFSLTLK
jgi:hypothetical protein